MSFIRQVVLNYEIMNVISFFCALFMVVIMPLPVYVILNIILTKHLLKPLGIALLLTSSATNYMMLKMGIRIDSSMIRNIFETNTREALDLITFSGFLWVFITGVIPSIFVYKTRIIFNTVKKEIIQRTALILISVLALLLYSASFYKVLVPFGRNNSKIQSLYNTLNYIYSTAKYFGESSKPKTFKIIDEKVKPDMFKDNLTDVMIIVVGETARAQNFSLGGYEKNTNPLLSKEKILFTLTMFPHVVRQPQFPFHVFFHQKIRKTLMWQMRNTKKTFLICFKRRDGKLFGGKMMTDVKVFATV